MVYVSLSLYIRMGYCYNVFLSVMITRVAKARISEPQKIMDVKTHPPKIPKYKRDREREGWGRKEEEEGEGEEEEAKN